jgi:phosphomannomutase
MFLEELGCTVHPLHCTPNGLFPHDPEPTFVNLQELCDYVKRGSVDVGVAVDPDADRVAIIGEDGAFIGEEYSLGLAADYHLRRKKGPVVTNVSTTRAVDDIAQSHGCECVRTPVGEVNVATKMKDLLSPIGGEGNGGVIDPRLHYGRDALVGIGMVLEYMAITGKRVTELASKLPRYHMVKTKVDCHKSYAHEIVARIRAEGEGDRTDLTDGLKIEWADSWVHLRASNTEPVMRLIAEARTEEEARALAERYGQKVASLLGELSGGTSSTRAAAP